MKTSIVTVTQEMNPMIPAPCSYPSIEPGLPWLRVTIFTYRV